MRIPALLLRHGRLALPKPPTPLHSRCRYYASEVEQHHHSLRADRQRVEAGLGGSQTQAVQSALTSNNAPTTSNESDRYKLDWDLDHHQKTHTAHLGTALGPHYKPHELLSNPPWPKDITLELLMASQSHIGHATSLWHPANARYIFGVRGEQDPIHIISLDVTAAHLRRACKVVRGVTERGGLVLFVGSREGQARAVVKAAQMASGCHLFSRWRPGSITNGQQLLGKCQKVVLDEHDRVVDGYEAQVWQKPALKPDLVVCLNPLENYVLLHECGLNNIPTIGIIDTNTNPTWVTYPIPANDDSIRCIQVVAGVLGRAGQEGHAIRIAKAKRGIVEYRQNHGLEPPTKEDELAKRKLDEAKRELEQKNMLLSGTDDGDVTQQPTFGFQEEIDGKIEEVDPSLLREQDISAQEDVYQPYERDVPLEGGEMRTLPESAGAFEYTPMLSPGENAKARGRRTGEEGW